MLEFSQEDFLRQSQVNLSDYSFGYPSDDWDKENKSIKSQMGVKTKINNHKIKNWVLKGYKGVS